MLQNILIILGITVFVVGLALVIRKRPKQETILSPKPDGTYRDDFICINLGKKGTIASSGGVSVRATRTKE